jgi:hypothetical protein
MMTTATPKRIVAKSILAPSSNVANSKATANSTATSKAPA